MHPNDFHRAPKGSSFLFLLTLLPAGLAQQSDPPAEPARRSPRLEDAQPLARMSGAIRVLHAFAGEESDFLGSSLCALGDISGDGVPDFALGAGRPDAHGYVLAISGKDGSTLTRWEGTRGDPGDGYGNPLSSVGDTDGDGIGDLAVGASGWNRGRGLAAIYSGSTHELRYALVGGTTPNERPSVSVGELPPSNIEDEPSEECWFGSLLTPAADVDADGCADFFVNDWLVSGKDGRPILRSEAIGLTVDVEDFPSGDADGDGFRDVLVAEGEPGPPDAQGGHPELARVRLIDGRRGKLLLQWTQRGCVDQGIFLCKAIGDVDGDRVVDFLTRTGPDRAPCAAWIVIRSGVDGGELFTIASDERGFGAQAESLGDLDGDGRAELLISDPGASIDGARGCGAAYVLSFGGD